MKEKASEQSQILKNSRIMVVITTISRCFGLLREMLIAFLMGTTRMGDVWSIANMLPNLFRRLIAEGAMSSAVVPILSELGDEERASKEFSRAMFSLILLVSTLIVTVMVILVPWVLPFLLSILKPTSVAQSAGTLDATVLPTQIMFPYLIFISLAAICQGVLNVNNRFALPAATPIVLNTCIIGFGYGLRDWGGNPIWGLCCGVLVGGFFQFALQWVRLFRLGVRLWPTGLFWNSRTAEAARLWFPTIFSAGIIQINVLIGTMIAANIFAGAAIAIQTSNRLMELILGVFTAAMSTSMLPVLSRQRARKDLTAMNESLWSSMAVMSMVTIPAALGLILAGPGVIKMLFLRGQFDMRSVELTYTALIFHAMALLPISWYRILGQTFYAFKQVRITVAIAGVGAVVNIAGCFVLPGYFTPEFAHCGVPLATLISTWTLFFISSFLVRRRFQLVWPSWFSWELLKIALAALAFVPVWVPFQSRIPGLAALLTKVLLSIGIYFICLKLFKSSSLSRLMGKK